MLAPRNKPVIRLRSWRAVLLHAINHAFLGVAICSFWVFLGVNIVVWIAILIWVFLGIRICLIGVNVYVDKIEVVNILRTRRLSCSSIDEVTISEAFVGGAMAVETALGPWGEWFDNPLRGPSIVSHPPTGAEARRLSSSEIVAHGLAGTVTEAARQSYRITAAMSVLGFEVDNSSFDHLNLPHISSSGEVPIVPMNTNRRLLWRNLPPRRTYPGGVWAVRRNPESDGQQPRRLCTGC